MSQRSASSFASSWDLNRLKVADAQDKLKLSSHDRDISLPACASSGSIGALVSTSNTISPDSPGLQYFPMLSRGVFFTSHVSDVRPHKSRKLGNDPVSVYKGRFSAFFTPLFPGGETYE